MTQSPENQHIDKRTLDYACNVIRREMELEFPMLTPVFIAHEPGKRKDAFEKARATIRAHPAGEIILPTARKFAALKDERAVLAGLGRGKIHSALQFWRAEQFIAVFFVSTASFETSQDAQRIIYGLCWQALHLLDQDLKRPSWRKKHKRGRLIRPSYKVKERMRQNMMRDVFAALAMELNGKKGTIEALAHQRCRETLSARPNHRPGLFPFPMAQDATLLVYEELSHMEGADSGVLHHALFMSEEVNLTYDDAMIDQWDNFSRAAQEMAWLGAAPEKILSAAIYTSENPFIKPLAYLVSETLKIDPAVIAKLDTHNPFAHPEVNERLHNKTCMKRFYEILDEALQSKNTSGFTNEIARQNAQILEGNPTGWCARSLGEAAKYFQDHMDDPDAGVQTEKIFQRARQALPWAAINEASWNLIRRKRRGINDTPESFTAYLKKTPRLALIAEAFETN